MQPDWARSDRTTRLLDNLADDVNLLPIKHQKIFAEILVVRLFLLIENSLASIASKLLCGAPYLDHSTPRRLVYARSINHARSMMQTHGRSTPLSNLSWTQSKDIRNNLDATLDRTDPFYTTILTYSDFLTELRYVRNHIVHANDNSRKNFQKIVRKHFGGLKRGMTPGLLLLTHRLGPHPQLKKYIVSGRMLLRELVRR